MRIEPLPIPEVLLITPRVFEDARGFFFESFNAHDFYKATGLSPEFVQDNHSKSARHVLRGLHYQIQQAQGKLLRVVVGEIFDVAVDIRPSSPTFGKWAGALLSSKTKQQLWIPPGFAHGFLTLSDEAELLYKTTDYYAPKYERTLLWNDPDIGIDWPLHSAFPLLSAKDQKGTLFSSAELFP